MAVGYSCQDRTELISEANTVSRAIVEVSAMDQIFVLIKVLATCAAF